MTLDAFRDASQSLQHLHDFLSPYFGPRASLCTIIDEVGRVTLTANGPTLVAMYLRTVRKAQSAVFGKLLWGHLRRIDTTIGDGVLTCTLLTAMAMKEALRWDTGTLTNAVLVSCAEEVLQVLENTVFPLSREQFSRSLKEDEHKNLLITAFRTQVSPTVASDLAEAIVTFVTSSQKDGGIHCLDKFKRYPSLCVVPSDNTSAGVAAHVVEGILVESSFVSSLLPQSGNSEKERVLILDIPSFDVERDLEVRVNTSSSSEDDDDEASDAGARRKRSNMDGIPLSHDYNLSPAKLRQFQEVKWAQCIEALRGGGVTLLLTSCVVPDGMVGGLAVAGIAAFGAVPSDIVHEVCGLYVKAALPFIPLSVEEVVSAAFSVQGFSSRALSGGKHSHVLLSGIHKTLCISHQSLSIAKEYAETCRRGIRLLRSAKENGVCVSGGRAWRGLAKSLFKVSRQKQNLSNNVVLAAYVTAIKWLPYELLKPCRRTQTDDAFQRRKYCERLLVAEASEEDLSGAIDAWAVYEETLRTSLNYFRSLARIDEVVTRKL